MNLIPINSKQIAYVRYDDQLSQMHIQYHTGQTQTCCGILPEQYQSLIQSPNAYDMIVKMSGPYPQESCRLTPGRVSAKA